MTWKQLAKLLLLCFEWFPFRKVNIEWGEEPNLCCCQVVWQKWTNQTSIFLFRTSINLFHSWRTSIRSKLMRISLFFMNVCQLRNKFILMRNKNKLVWFVHFCQTTWQQHICTHILETFALRFCLSFVCREL